MPPQLTDFSWQSSLKKIQDGNQKDRLSGLEDLVFLFDKKAKTATLSQLDDKSYHQIFDTLFRCVLSEKQNYYSSKRTTKASASTRLEKAAEALRATLKHGASKIKRKTMLAVVDHITQTLPGPDGQFVEPLLQGYMKGLANLLGHATNVEHLGTYDGAGWLTCVDFVVATIEHYLGETDRESDPSRASPGPGSLVVRSAGFGTQRNDLRKDGRNPQDLLQCLLHLVSAPNTPLLQRSRQISEVVIRVLQSRFHSISPAQQFSFAILDFILTLAQSDDNAHADALAKDLIPLISHWWLRCASKEDALLNRVRTEMLKVLLNLHIQLDHLVKDSDATSLLTNIEELSEVMWSEYSKRDNRGQLQLDDLTFSPTARNESALNVKLFALRPHNIDSEKNWAVVLVLALLEVILWKSGRLHQASLGEVDEQPRKKRRTAEGSSLLRQKLRSTDRSLQLAALQVIPFFVSFVDLDATDILETMSVLAVLASDKTMKTSAWAMIASASVTQLGPAAHESLMTVWKQIWQMATRSISLLGTCRASCVLLHCIVSEQLVKYETFSGDVNAIVTAADVSGPAILMDASILLMSKLLHLRNYHSPSASHATSSHVVRWTFLRWDPADPVFIAVNSVHVGALDIVNLLLATFSGNAAAKPRSHQAVGGPISETWSRLLGREPILRYLLLLNDAFHTPLQASLIGNSRHTQDLPQSTDISSAQLTKKLITELMFSKIEEISLMCDNWVKRGDGSEQVSAEKLQSAFGCLLTGTILLPTLREVNLRQSQDLEPGLSLVTKTILQATTDSSESQSLVECLLRIIRPYIPAFTGRDLELCRQDTPELLRLFSELSSALGDRETKRLSATNQDSMDLDEDFESQESRISTASKTIDFSRRQNLTLAYSSFYLDVTQSLHFVGILYQDPGQIGLLPSSFLDGFLEISDEEILCCHRLFIEILSSDLVINPDDALRIIQRIGALIGSVAFQSCELAQAMCLNAMEGIINLWHDQANELSELIGDLYSYFVKSAFPNNSLSSQVQISLARLLFRLNQVNEKFPETVSSPITSASIMDILHKSSNVVKFYIGQELPLMFGRYVLKTHEDVFLDVLASLPQDPEATEGIALRLFVLAELGQRWPTLLRRCVYHIFETPGKIPNSANHATWCLQRISTSLKLEDSKALFDLFAPQLLYTWLEDDPIQDIPFAIFGFASLKDLYDRAQSEITALMVMRGQDAAVAEVAQALGISTTQMIQHAFSKVMAYSMAHDISISKQDQSQSGESRVRKILGRENYLEHIYINFVDIVALFFNLIDQEEHIEKSWAKDGKLRDAADLMAEIKKCGHSQVDLLANQQPMFKPKYLARELLVLCGRTEYELSSLWSPTLVVAVARRLLNGVHPALGPLHACSVVRKLRVLICMAGHHAWESYALEMLLQSIRPFIFDTECADDAMGITQFLLARGAEELKQIPSFLAGYALSVLASLRVFLESSQSSTTQESQFKATMSKAQQFHSWFSKYLGEYKSPRFVDDDQRSAFKVITQSAAHVRSSGNAERGTYESKLLLEVLQDELDGGTQLLNESSRRLAVKMMSKDFTIPDRKQQDCISSDSEASAIATAVWKSCQAQTIDGGYLAWAGRVVGRGFAASGYIDRDLLQESDQAKYQKLVGENSASEQAILSMLRSLVSDEDCFTAGLAEAALRGIVSEAADQEDNALLTACQKTLSDQLLGTSSWSPYRTPPTDNPPVAICTDEEIFTNEGFMDERWPQRLTAYLSRSTKDSVILPYLAPILAHSKEFAKEAFPFVVHLVLLLERNKQQAFRKTLSESLKKWQTLLDPLAKANLSLMLNAILYLRTQRIPGESSIAERVQWLDLDLASASAAATRCGMYRTALLFIELASNESTRSSRRSSALRAQESSELLLDIFENIDDPDAYYGLPDKSSLSSVLSRLEHEKEGSKSLAFRGAQYDSHLRRKDAASSIDSRSLVGTLSNLGLSGLSHSLLQTQQASENASISAGTIFENARVLEKWNLPAPSTTENPAINLYKAYQSCHQAADLSVARKALNQGFGQIMQTIGGGGLNAASLRHQLATLASLSELDDALGASSSTDLNDLLSTFQQRSSWMKSGRYDDVRSILSCRETTFSMFGQNHSLRGPSPVHPPEIRLIEVKSMILSSGIYRFHQATQESLNIATSLNDLIEPSDSLGLCIDAAAKLEVANSLWDHGEMMSSIHLLRSIDEDSNLKKQTVPVPRPDLLAKIGNQISLAKLEKPETIQKNYLQPALKELRGKTDGEEAGKVYHQFATFCDEQLQNPDGLDDLARLQNLRKGKDDEVSDLKSLITNTRDSQQKTRYQAHLSKAKQWLDLDEQELRRVEQSRSEFVRLSLENYLLALIASDEHDNDALRFTALWLERSGEDFTNEAVRKYLDKVPTSKLAPLITQLTSRLQDQDKLFQSLLIDLVYKICVDHPYHGMYQIWSGTKTRTNKEDEVAVLRHKATEKVAKKLSANASVAAIWTAIDKTSRGYHTLAAERDSSRYKQSAKIPIKDSRAGASLQHILSKYRIPPPTMQMDLSTTKDYSHIPYIVKIEANMTIASGVSAPKIITVVGSDGQRYKQLVKGGNDDLRQDAIMEQVFAAVSAVLKRHRATQQRNLGIRTYKVLPLTSASGLIEFVSNTIPLHEYLMPAHERYHPKDLKGTQCRKEISAAQPKSAEVRVATYRKVTDRFQPVMRYFFMENFVDPDEWFVKRTAYTRTTAAISILGHVLGLGDRHGHNILLDQKTGEVVHIDLGVAFEMGRVLPVPELVPFRMTRDIVDGMGITKTEGVFRRCCEFTLDALREETYSIMTILDVLRYDPLYSWSMSPVRMARLQDGRRDDEAAGTAVDDGDAEATDRRRNATGTTKAPGGVVNEPSEADRALEVVRKKLSKTLSVTATVNDLINQATDEKNLAVLYSGWAAYA